MGVFAYSLDLLGDTLGLKLHLSPSYLVSYAMAITEGPQVLFGSLSNLVCSDPIDKMTEKVNSCSCK